MRNSFPNAIKYRKSMFCTKIEYLFVILNLGLKGHRACACLCFLQVFSSLNSDIVSYQING